MNKKTIITITAIIIAFFLSPLLIELILTHGLFGWKPFTTAFERNDWLAFWGSYLGGGLTIIAILVSISIGNKSLKVELDKQRITFENRLKLERTYFEEDRTREIYDEIIKDIDSLYNNLTEDAPSSIVNILLNDKLTQGRAA